MHSRVIFSPNYLRWPFEETVFEPETPLGDYRDALPPELRDRVLRWNEYFLEHYSETDGRFPSQEHRAHFDREYIALANELWNLGLTFDINMWW